MERILFKLQEYVIENIQPNNLIQEVDPTASLENWRRLWSHERDGIKQDFADHLMVGNDYNVSLLSGITFLGDLVYNYLTKYGKIWQRIPDKENIRVFYQYVLYDLQSFAEFLSGFDPHAFQLAVFPISELASIKQALNFELKKLEEHLANFKIDNELTIIFTKTVRGYIRGLGLTRRERDYLMQLMKEVTALAIIDTPILKTLLYQYNFNQPAYFMYCVNEWSRSLSQEPGLYEQMELLIMEQDRLSDMRVNHQIGLHRSEESLNAELSKYLHEKSQTVRELINLRRSRLQDNELAKLALRIKINMPVAQLGLFIRLQLEKGILLKDNVGKLFGFYATHFYTPQTDSISPQSLQKKSTEIEYATAQKLKAVLIGMINWLNENFKLSDS